MIIIKRLYITDLDGTLLDSSGKVSVNTVKIINSLIGNGIYFTFATARSVYSAKPITAGININVPCILMNGVSIY
ncbi:MAG: HAD family hydrolase, partial [Ruminococcus sp.]|nr:HAD family hydrolase [Ruminococcus sp.]